MITQRPKAEGFSLVCQAFKKVADLPSDVLAKLMRVLLKRLCRLFSLVEQGIALQHGWTTLNFVSLKCHGPLTLKESARMSPLCLLDWCCIFSKKQRYHFIAFLSFCIYCIHFYPFRSFRFLLGKRAELQPSFFCFDLTGFCPNPHLQARKWHNTTKIHSFSRIRTCWNPGRKLLDICSLICSQNYQTSSDFMSAARAQPSQGQVQSSTCFMGGN